MRNNTIENKELGGLLGYKTVDYCNMKFYGLGYKTE